jgi:signal peptidase II
VKRIAPYLRGPFTRFGVVTAVAACALDQALKLWLIFSYQLARRGVVVVTPFFDLVMAWNTGISYGLFAGQGAVGQAMLLAFKAIAVVLLWVWLARVTTRLSALSLGLIIGGAIGNGIDRLAYGAVADFALLHLDTVYGRFNWYVFNLADAAIVAGVIGLLYESLAGGTPQNRPDPGA